MNTQKILLIENDSSINTANRNALELEGYVVYAARTLKTGTVVKSYDYGTVINLPTPTRDGYDFLYWEGSRYDAGEEYTVLGAHSFTAIWEEIIETETESESKQHSDKGTTDHKKPDTPETGDESNNALWAVMLPLSLAILVFTARRRRKF